MRWQTGVDWLGPDGGDGCVAALLCYSKPDSRRRLLGSPFWTVTVPHLTSTLWLLQQRFVAQRANLGTQCVTKILSTSR